MVILLSLTVIFQGKLDLFRQFNGLLKDSEANRNAVVLSSLVISLRLSTSINLFLCLFLLCLLSVPFVTASQR